MFLEALEGHLISRFILQRNNTFSDEIREWFVEGNCDAFDDSIVNILNSLGTHYKLYKEKARSSELSKTTQYCLKWLAWLK